MFWRSNPQKKYPRLFDEELTKAPSFRAYRQNQLLWVVIVALLDESVHAKIERVFYLVSSRVFLKRILLRRSHRETMLMENVLTGAILMTLFYILQAFLEAYGLSDRRVKI